MLCIIILLLYYNTINEEYMIIGYCSIEERDYRCRHISKACRFRETDAHVRMLDVSHPEQRTTAKDTVDTRGTT